MTTETAQPQINSATVETTDNVVRHQVVIVGGRCGCSRNTSCP